jgi:tetratricopeptide (TPR) repeat protein
MKVDPRAFKGLSRFLAPSSGGPVADRAVSEKLVTPEQLHECVLEQDRSGRPLDEILVERGYLKEEDASRLRSPAVPVEVLPWLNDPERILGHYVLVSVLGTGGMAEVWKAWDRSLGRWVAVKHLKREIGHPTQRIEREGRMAGQLSHPSIISIFERGQHAGRAYLVMPFVDGAPPKTPLPAREAARLALEVARALAHAHEAGVIHRDVKPANILVEAGGRVVLADFGLAILDDTATSRWAMSGTPEYASPEQIRGDPLDARTDIYSLGATLYHMLAGKPPFTGTGVEEITAKVLKEDPPKLEGVPKRLAAVVRRAMSRDRESRFADVLGFAAELESFIEKSRSGFHVRPLWIAVAILSAGIPWVLTLIILQQLQVGSERREVLQALREADRKLSRAERLRAEPSGGDAEARQALVNFRLALRWSRDGEPEAWVGVGRCYEFLGEENPARDAYEMAGNLPAARSALAWLSGRSLLSRRQERDWKTYILKNIPAPHPVRLLAEGKWEAILALPSPAGDDDSMALVQGVAAVELGRWDDALRCLDAGLRTNSHDGTLMYYRGAALAGKGDAAGAKAAWIEAQLRLPKDAPLRSDVRRRLADVEKK